MLSPHISSAFAQERQSRYRKEAEVQRLATRRHRRDRDDATRTRRATADPPDRARTLSPAPSPAH